MPVKTWNGGTDNLWSTTTNWTGVGVPATNDSVVFDNTGANRNISLNAGNSAALAAMTVSATGYTFLTSNIIYAAGFTLSDSQDITNVGFFLSNGGTGTFTKNGVGTMTVRQFGDGPLTFNAGSTIVTTGTGFGSTGNDITLNNSASFTTNSGVALPTGASTRRLILNNTSTATLQGIIGNLTVNGGTATWSGSGYTSGVGPHFFGTAGATTAIYNQTGSNTLAATSAGSANGMLVGGYAGCVTAFYHSNGTVSSNLVRFTIGASSFGTTDAATDRSNYTYYQLTGGTLTLQAAATGNTYIAASVTAPNQGNRTVFDIAGGTLNSTSTNTATMILGNSQAGSVINVLTGSRSMGAGTSLSFGTSGLSAGTFPNIINIAGGTSLTFTTALTMGANAAGSSSIINVGNAATFTTASITASGASPKFINLWGGTFVASLTTSSVSGAGGLKLQLYADTVTPANVNTLSALTGSGLIAADIVEGTGSGVSALGITSGGSGYVGPPLVTITGDGTGATARAEISGGAVSSIVVTSPGYGYTTASFTLAGGLPVTGGTAATPGSVTLGYTNSAGQGFTKSNTGTLTLTGANTFTGTATISGGTLAIGNSSTAGTLGNNDASAVSIGSGFTLSLNRTDVSGSAPNYSGVISGAGNILKNPTGGGYAKLSGSNTFAGTVTIGTNSGNVLIANGTNALGSGATAAVTVNTGCALQVENGVSSARTLTITGSGVSSTGAILNNSGTNTLSGAVTLGGSTVIGSSGGTLNLTSATSISGGTSSLTFVGAGDISISSAIATSSGTLTKNDAGTTNLLNPSSSFTGAVTVNGGTLAFTRLANGGSNSSIGAGTGTITLSPAAATLQHVGGYTSSTDRTITSSSTASGATVTLDASGAGTGPMIFTGGFVGGGAAVPKTLALKGSNTSNNGITAVLSNTSLSTVGGTLALTKDGSGTWVLSAANTYTRGTTISAGTLVADSATGDARFGSGAVTVPGGTIQTLTGTTQKGRHTYSGNLSFAGGGKLKIGGYAGSGAIYMTGNLVLPTGSDKTTFDLSKDARYKVPGTYTLVEFAPTFGVTGSGTAAANITIIPYAGTTAGTPAYAAEGSNSPARITVTIS